MKQYRHLPYTLIRPNFASVVRSVTLSCLVIAAKVHNTISIVHVLHAAHPESRGCSRSWSFSVCPMNRTWVSSAKLECLIVDQDYDVLRNSGNNHRSVRTDSHDTVVLHHKTDWNQYPGPPCHGGTGLGKPGDQPERGWGVWCECCLCLRCYFERQGKEKGACAM